jgi:hypothetical protein
MSRSVRARVSAWACCAAILAVSGCAQHTVAARTGSEQACVQFGVRALETRSTVTAVPAACRGLTTAEINQAVATALSAVARSTVARSTVAGTAGGNVGGKAASRARAASLSPLLNRLIGKVSAPSARQAPEQAQLAAPAGDRETLGIPALAVWLLTAALGTAMIRRWIMRLLSLDKSSSQSPAGGRLPPAVILAHPVLALAGLVAWAVYLIAGWTGAGWFACAVLLLVTSLGVALISLWLPERGPGRHPPAALIMAHGVLAVTTITLVLTALISG